MSASRRARAGWRPVGWLLVLATAVLAEQPSSKLNPSLRTMSWIDSSETLDVRVSALLAKLVEGERKDSTSSNEVIEALKNTTAPVAVMAVGVTASAELAGTLSDYYIQDLGDLAPPIYPACYVSEPNRNLLELQNISLISYYLPKNNEVVRRKLDEAIRKLNNTYTPERCLKKNVTCATILTNTRGVLMFGREVERLELWARVVAMDERALGDAVRDTGAPACHPAPQLSALATLELYPLAPPACPGASLSASGEKLQACAWEPRRLVKYASMYVMKDHRKLKELRDLKLETEDLRELALNPDEAVVGLTLKPCRPQEVSVLALVPDKKTRKAAIKVEEKMNSEGFQVDNCNHNFKMRVPGLTSCSAADGVASELRGGSGRSAVLGPACRTHGFRDVVRTARAAGRPVLAFTPQVIWDPQHNSSLMLGAGEVSRGEEAALRELMRQYGWARGAVLAPAGMPAPRPADHLDITDVNDSYSNESYSALVTWAQESAASGATVLWVRAGAAATQAALCAGLGSGLTPERGTVWVLPPQALLSPPPAKLPCTPQEIRAQARGHFSFALPWQAPREHNPVCNRSSTAGTGLSQWSCIDEGVGEAALVYDLLLLWTRGLRDALHRDRHPDWSQDETHRTVITNITQTSYTGITGKFQWEATGSAWTRVVPLLITQWWENETLVRGQWAKGALSMGEVRWQTEDGATPRDRALTEQCVLGGLADALHVSCRVAALLAGAGLLLGALLLSAGVALYCRRRLQARFQRHLEEHGLPGLHKTALTPSSCTNNRWELLTEHLILNRKIGTGAFGTVFGGHARLPDDEKWTAVAVKTLKIGATTEEKLDFLYEAEVMKRFDHLNVVKLLGVVTKEEPVRMVMEFMLYGDLRTYLLARRHLATAVGDDEASEEVSPRRLTLMALDVARALAYLAQQGYVHRDVAARNCLVTSGRCVKLGDFGMTRLVFENDYYRLSRRGILPVRWMAPESLCLGLFSAESDIWSFGVLMYEIVTFGSLPYQGLSNNEVLVRLKEGKTLELPAGLKPALRGLVAACWQRDRHKRPAARDVTAYLASDSQLLTPCLDLPFYCLLLGDSPHVSSGTDTTSTYISSENDPICDTDPCLS